MSPVLLRLSAPPPILGGCGRVCYKPFESLPLHPSWVAMGALDCLSQPVIVSCVCVRIRFIQLSGFVMCYIARRRDSGRFTFHFTGSAGGVPAASGAPWCGPAAPRQPVARQPCSSVDLPLGISAPGSSQPGSSLVVFFVPSSCLVVSRPSSLEPVMIQVRSVVSVSGIGVLVGWPQGLWSLSS